MTNYKGFVLITESNKALQLPEKTEIIKAERIWLPNVQNVYYLRFYEVVRKVIYGILSI